MAEMELRECSAIHAIPLKSVSNDLFHFLISLFPPRVVKTAAEGGTKVSYGLTTEEWSHFPFLFSPSINNAD